MDENSWSRAQAEGISAAMTVPERRRWRWRGPTLYQVAIAAGLCAMVVGVGSALWSCWDVPGVARAGEPEAWRAVLPGEVPSTADADCAADGAVLAPWGVWPYPMRVWCVSPEIFAMLDLARPDEWEIPADEEIALYCRVWHNAPLARTQADGRFWCGMPEPERRAPQARAGGVNPVGSVPRMLFSGSMAAQLWPSWESELREECARQGGQMFPLRSDRRVVSPDGKVHFQCLEVLRPDGKRLVPPAPGTRRREA